MEKIKTEELEEDVAFFIPGTFGDNQKTLLGLSMENQFQNLNKHFFWQVNQKLHVLGLKARIYLQTCISKLPQFQSVAIDVHTLFS